MTVNYSDVIDAARRTMGEIDARRTVVDSRNQEATRRTRNEWFERRIDHLVVLHRQLAGKGWPHALLKQCTVACLLKDKVEDDPSPDRIPVYIAMYYGPHELRFRREFEQFGELVDPVEMGLVSMVRPPVKKARRAFVHEVVAPPPRLGQLRMKKSLPGQRSLFDEQSGEESAMA